MARLNRPGSTHNNAQIVDMWLSDANGEEFGFLDCINGDITLTPSQIGTFTSRVRQFAVAELDGPTTDGSIAIPLKIRAMTATFGTGNPSLLDILAQNNNRGIYRPLTSISVPAVGDLPARTIYATPNSKAWNIYIQTSTAPIDGAPYQALWTSAVYVPTPPMNLSNVGADDNWTLTGKITDPNLGYWKPV